MLALRSLKPKIFSEILFHGPSYALGLKAALSLSLLERCARERTEAIRIARELAACTMLRQGPTRRARIGKAVDELDALERA